MCFYKLEATGNDFILIINESNDKYKVKELCDRNKGIGADGLITIDNYLNIKIYNSDGSEAKMCGNGLRCICKLLSHLTNNNEHTINLNNQQIYLKQINKNNAFVEMPTPIMLFSNNGYFVSVLNNHFIILTDNVDKFVFDKGHIDLSNKRKCNIHAVQIINKEIIKMKSYEYGAKETKSCGSGAVASFFLLYMLNKVSNKVSIIQPGGKVTCFTNNNKYYLQGEVNLLFKGELIYEF